MADDIGSALALIGSALAFIGVAAFFSLWLHRAEGNRALTMGLYIVFGAFGFFLFLFGLGSMWRDYQEGIGVGQKSVLALVIGLIAGIGLLPPLRRIAAKIIPFDPGSKPDMIGLILLGQITALSIVALFFETGESEPVGYVYLVVQNIAFIALAFLAVGIYFYRTPQQALARLGLTRMTWRQGFLALGFMVAAFVVAGLSSMLVNLLQPDLYDEIQDNLTSITSNVNTHWGALLLGISSGAGEETLFRGAIQPRYGIIFTSLVFSLLHVQYGASFITVGVFAAGILFGLERKYLNTTACIITHALYNTIAIAITLS